MMHDAMDLLMKTEDRLYTKLTDHHRYLEVFCALLYGYVVGNADLRTAYDGYF